MQLIGKTYIVTGFFIDDQFTDRSIKVRASSAEEAMKAAARRVGGYYTDDTIVQAFEGAWL